MNSIYRSRGAEYLRLWRYWSVYIADSVGWLNQIDGEVVSEYVNTAGPLNVKRHNHMKLQLVSGIKRAVDIAVAGLALIFFAPLMLFIAALIRLESKGPVFFSAPRIGSSGEVFHVFKFRTMSLSPRSVLRIQGSDAVHSWTLKSDPRITRIGRFLRRYALDELPIFLNVLRGDMSLVGPSASNPALISLPDRSRRRAPSEMRPGIIGLWQLQARFDPAVDLHNELNDLYCANWSLTLDLKIMAAAVRSVALGDTVVVSESTPKVKQRVQGMDRDDTIRIVSEWDEEWVCVAGQR